MQDAKRRNTKLLAARSQRHWTQEEAAEKCGVSRVAYARWEEDSVIPRAWALRNACDAFRMSAEQLGFDKQPIPIQMIAEEQSAIINYHQQSVHVSESNAMDKTRRDLLYLLSAGSTALFLPFPDLDWEKFEDVLLKPSRLDSKVVNSLETICQHYWSVFRASPSKMVVLDGVMGQLKTLIGLLKEGPKAQLHKQLCTIASNLAQLAGEIFFDLNDYHSAQACYTFAADAAKEAKQFDLWACALVRHSFLPIYSGQHRDALPLLQSAEVLAKHGDTTLVTRYWVAAVLAQAYAGSGNLIACQKSLDLAQEVHDSPDGVNGTWLRFDGTRLPEERGACFVKLGYPILAQSALQEALAQRPPLSRRRGMVLTDLARASLQQRNIEETCAHIQGVLEIAMHGSSGVLKKGVQEVRDHLEPFSDTAHVKELDSQLRLLI